MSIDGKAHPARRLVLGHSMFRGALRRDCLNRSGDRRAQRPPPLEEQHGQPFRKAELDFVARLSGRHDVVPVVFDQCGGPDPWVDEMAQDMELVEQNMGLWSMPLDRVAERFPYVQHRQPNPRRLLEAQIVEEPVQIGLVSSLPTDSDRVVSIEITGHGAIRVAFFERQISDADGLRGWLRRLGLHVQGI